MRKLLTILALSLFVGACSSESKPETTTPTTTSIVDPYDTYLRNNPDPSLILSREDAQLRALLGCGTKWAPLTVDAVLQEAYDVCDG